MTQELPPIELKGKELRKFRYLRRKYPVSLRFLNSNWGNAKRFIIYALNPRCVLRNYCWRKRNRVLLLRRARLLLFDPRLKTMIKNRKAHMKQWSPSLVAYYKKIGQVTEYEEMELYGDELSKQMKQQLELLKSGKRGISLIEDANKNVELRLDQPEEEMVQGVTREEEKAMEEGVEQGDEQEPVNVEKTHEAIQLEEDNKQDEQKLVKESAQISKEEVIKKSSEDLSLNSLEEPVEKMTTQSAQELASESPEKISHESTEEPDPKFPKDQALLCTETLDQDPVEELTLKSTEEQAPKSQETSTVDSSMPSISIEKTQEKAGGSNFLDMLMNKVRVKNFAKESNFSQAIITSYIDSSTSKPSTAESNSDFSFNDDTSEDFVGFDETAHQPGMLLTPLVPLSGKTTEGNGAFVSEALEAYMKKNNLRESNAMGRERLLEPMYQDGRVTRHSMPPHMDMPAVPDSLQKLRTVAERRLYLQRCKNQKMAIINNEANIYRELQRKQRQRKVKIAAMQQLQSSGSLMPFTRQGWQAASYVSTDHDKYYYQVIRIDGEMVRLPGSQGNNLKREKQPHRNQLTPQELAKLKCTSKCVDANLWAKLKIINTRQTDLKKLQKLNKSPLTAIFPPCPLSQKPFQKPLDDDTAALLLAGGSMAIVSMPTVQLDVQPQLGRPLDEIAKRYLQYILPHHDITREWAEFSVSTLQESPNSMREAQAQAATTNAGRRKSFTFVIPYLNDRNHILVRRVVDRSEQLDENFTAALPEEKLREFEFRKELTQTSDSIALDCADMLNDMINTVAISCSENSFISIDPDAVTEDKAAVRSMPSDLLSKTIGKVTANKQQQQQRRLANNNNKQSRLAKELRRLNATIIDAAAIAKDANKPCLKDYCQLGCLCESLTGERPSREHCGRAECVLECGCTGAELTRVMRVETDGRGLSNEDAFNLRRQATARLAKMEKDFTSTLVLTDNETLLINETQCDKKRRCTKAPKRYEDFDDSIEDDEEPVRPTKMAKREASLKRSPESVKLTSPSPLPLPEPCKVKDTDFEQLQHCQVTLRRLPDMANQAIFCMTHQLYNCFCGGLSPDGKPIIIEKEQSDPPIPHYVPELATRAHYSFERAQETPPPTPQGKKKKKQQQQQQTTTAADDQPSTSPPAPPPIKSPVILKKYPPRNEELEIIFCFYRSRPYLCRRAVAVPKKCYLRINRRRADRLRSEISKAETLGTQKLLNKRIFSAVRFYRAELDSQRRMEQLTKRPHQQLDNEPTVILVRDDSDESESVPNTPAACKRSAATELPGVSLLKVQHQPPNKRKKEDIPEKPVTVKQMPPIQFVPIAPNSTTPPIVEELPPIPVQLLPPPAQINMQMPKISGCYSLCANSAIEVPMSAIINHDENGTPTAATTGSSRIGQQHLTAPMNSPTFRSSYNDVIKKMNMHVSKKMQDIDMALQRESKIIPAPNAEILCIIKWANFVAAFESDYVFIWDVQMKNEGFLAATITNMMPTVPGAIGVVNIRFSPDRSALPLMARMLLDSIQNVNTSRLAVVMQGREHYWLVRGFLRYTCHTCTKPTPQTHPILTKKINVLCTLMLKQKIREKQRLLKAAMKIASSEHGVVDLVNQPTIAINAMPTETTPSTDSTPASASASPTSNSVLGLATLESSLTTAPPPPQIRDSPISICSNIEFRKVMQADVHELQIPELHAYDHRWLVLDLYDDFSHIFVPAFRDMISLDRINNVLRMAHATRKVVKLLFFQNAPYDAFVTSSSKRKIYFGPLRLDAQPPVLVLLQSVDGKMMLREVYQRDHSIEVQQDKRTMCFWLIQINKQVHFDIDVYKEGLKTGTLFNNNSSQTLAQKQPQLGSQDTPNVAKEGDDDDDDDCVIVINDEDDELEEKQDVEKDKELEIRNEQTTKSLQRLTHFTIQAMPNKGGALHITSRAPSLSNSNNVEHTSTLAPGRFLPINTDESTKAQFLKRQVQIKKSSVTSATSSSELPPAKISRISLNANQSPQLPRINNSLQKLLSGGNNNMRIGTATGGVTITKLINKDGGAIATKTTATVSSTAATPAVVEPIKIGSKRKMSSSLPSSSSAAAAESMLEQIDMPSLGKLESLLMRPATATTTQDPKVMRPVTATTTQDPKVMRPVTTTTTQDPKVQAPTKAVEPALPKIKFPTAIIDLLKDELKAAQQAKVQPPAPAAAAAATVEKPKMQFPTPTVAAQPAKIPTPPVGAATAAAKKPNSPSSPAADVVENPKDPLTPDDATKVVEKPNNTLSAPDAAQPANIPAPTANAEQSTVFTKSSVWPQATEPYKSRYGYLIAKGLPRYRVKLSEGKFMVKMPEEGIFSFRSSAAAGAYLNRTLSRKSKFKMHLPADWKFLQFDNSPIVIED